MPAFSVDKFFFLVLRKVNVIIFGLLFDSEK